MYSDLLKMSSDRCLRNLLFALLLIYLGQGILYKSGSLISQASLFIYLSISAYYGFKYVKQKERNIFGNLMLVFLAINLIYWMFSPQIIAGHKSFVNLKNNVFFILTFYPFYFLSKNEVLTIRSLQIFLMLIFGVYTAQYFLKAEFLMGTLGKDNIVNNGAYYFVSMLPLMGIFFRNKLMYFLLYLISLYLVISSAKRGAIISFALGSIIAFYFLLKDIETKNRYRNIIIVIIGLGFVIYYGYQQIIENSFVQRRFELAFEGNYSNRDIIYTDILNNWLYSGHFINVLFGYGFNGSLFLNGSFAHNDWLEVLSGQGFIGVILYLIILFSIWKYYLSNNIFMNNEQKSIFLSTLGIWFLQSLFSSVYGGFFTFSYILCLALIMGSIDQLKEQNYQIEDF